MKYARLKHLGLLVLLLASTGFRSLAAEEPVLTGDKLETTRGDLVIHPINHATLALAWNKLIIYVDPVGGAERYAGLPRPNLILITDIHGDHLNVDTLKAIGEQASLIAPAAVTAQLPEGLRKRTTVLTNNETTTVGGVFVRAIPAYNLSAERLKFHPEGRGNGYVLTLGDKRVYFSGDTEDITEMRTLKNIEVAFVCMNLPYTMDVNHAASAVREFRPRIVYPYHYRGSELDKFKKLVGDDAGVEVRLRQWYP